MKINTVSKEEFYDLAYSHTKDFMAKINAPEAFIVKKIFDAGFIRKLRNDTFDWGISSEASWHPLKDGCPDYHRLHDNYPQAYVKQKFHGFYRHGWYEKNSSIFEAFKGIYELKNYLGGFDKDSFIKNIPSQGVVARLNVHHYPVGGGYQAEHIDPAGPFAEIQTLIIASEKGKDYKTGGVYARKELGGEKFYLDDYVETGDMLVVSPAIPHGVEPIDPELPYTWNTNNGRWIILPLFLFSDYPNPDSVKPKQVK
ncbi:MAG: hypothetical protein ACLQQ4_16170 [Bacteroidia bacterium]